MGDFSKITDADWRALEYRWAREHELVALGILPLDALEPAPDNSSPLGRSQLHGYGYGPEEQTFQCVPCDSKWTGFTDRTGSRNNWTNYCPACGEQDDIWQTNYIHKFRWRCDTCRLDWDGDGTSRCPGCHPTSTQPYVLCESIAIAQLELQMWARLIITQASPYVKAHLDKLPAHIGQELRALQNSHTSERVVCLAVAEAILAIRAFATTSKQPIKLSREGDIEMPDGKCIPANYFATCLADRAEVDVDLGAYLWTAIVKILFGAKTALPGVFLRPEGVSLLLYC